MCQSQSPDGDAEPTTLKFRSVLHGTATWAVYAPTASLRELQDSGRRYNFQRFSKYEAYLLTHTVHGGITIFSVAYVADCFALSLNVAFFEQ